jgi:hypothetical protein
MVSQTTLSFWQLLFVAVGPACLTAFVALLVPFVSEARKQKIEKKKRKIEKLEELIEEIYENHHWHNLFFQKFALRKDVEPGQPPIFRAKAIILLHFPQLKKEIDDFVVKSKNYELWALDLAEKNLRKEHVDVASSKPLYKSLLDAEEKLLLAAVRLGQKDLGL